MKDKRLKASADLSVFLGLQGDEPRFAHDMSSWDPGDTLDVEPDTILDRSTQSHPDFPEDWRFANLRSVMTSLRTDEAELTATAKSLLGWHATNSFCSNCGARTWMTMAGWQRSCSACGTEHFCRTDPVVIMLILDGNSVLIGRSFGWPKGMYSLLAGFMEPGESVEAAVRREVQEETGVLVGEVNYLASQTWPFPCSLMLGCRGVAEHTGISVNTGEIEDALWITREQMLEAYCGNHGKIRPPRQGSIANALVRAWMEGSVV